MRTTRRALKAQIKTLAAEKREMNKQRHAFVAETRGSTEPDRLLEIYNRDGRRKSARETLRYLHLAYAFARYKPFKEQEAKNREGNRASVWQTVHTLLTYHQLRPDQLEVCGGGINEEVFKDFEKLKAAVAAWINGAAVDLSTLEDQKTLEVAAPAAE